MIRKSFLKFTTQFTAMLNEVKGDQAANKVITPEMLTHVRETVVTGLRKLSHWSGRIKEQSAWKYSKPIDDQKYRELGGKGGPGQEYEKVVKYNYTPDELEALIDIIGMLKG